MFEAIKSMFKPEENQGKGEIRATQKGVAVPLTQVPDKIIREEILGKGLAIIPTNGRVVAPVGGKITNIAKTGHALFIQANDGLDVLIHIGIDTVALNGNGFHVLVEEGQYVTPGMPICDVDLAVLKANNLQTHTCILITNSAKLKQIDFFPGDVAAGKTVVAKYELND